IISAGSSYTMNFGYIDFELGSKKYKSSSLGMDGNNIFVPLRSAFETLDTPNLEVLDVAVSALNMLEIGPVKPAKVHKNQRLYAGNFPYECVDSIRSAGLGYGVGFLSSCQAGGDFGALKILAAAAVPATPIFFQ